MRLLIADKLTPLVVERLGELDVEVHSEPKLAGDELTRSLEWLDPEALVVRSTRVSAAHIEAAPRLALIVRAGAGVNTIDRKAASARGVYVANCPGKNAAAVAELAIGHLINLDRRISDGVHALREHRWEKKAFGGAPGLSGRTLAVLGCGQIGREVIRRARALEMDIVAWSRSLDDAAAEALGVRRAESIEAAVRDADAVTVHLALAEGTRGCVDGQIFSAMKEGAYFINTSRGEVVDQDALLRAVKDRGLRAGLDVFAEEPSGGAGEFSDPIADEPNVYGTHHIGASTVQAEEAVGEEVVRIVTAYVRGRPIPNCVNLAHQSQATHTLVVRHADRVGVLAELLGVLREAGHNVQEMQNVVFSGSEAACARIAIVGEPDGQTLERIDGAEHVFAVTTTPREGDS